MLTVPHRLGTDLPTGSGIAVDAPLRFTAPETGDCAIYINERSGERGISYALTVERLQS